MKKLFLFLTAIVPFLASGQLTPTENYVYKATYVTAVATEPASPDLENGQMQQVNYFDEAGRPKQNILVNAGGAGEEIFSHYEYDASGRQAKQWLPYSNNFINNLGYNPTVPSDIVGFYQSKFPGDYLAGGTNAYSQTVYENFPGGKAIEQAAPGTSWKLIDGSDADHTVKMQYATNIDNDVADFDIAYPGITPDYMSPTLVFSGFYKKNQLYVSIVKNENWKTTDVKSNTTETYTDKSGKTVLTRTYDKVSGADVPHNTYYVYDDFENLIFVYTPKASETFVFSPVNSTPSSQVIPKASLITYPAGLPPLGTGATITIASPANTLNITFNLVFGKGTLLKTGSIAALTATGIPDMTVGNITNGSYNFRVSIQSGQLYITDINSVRIPVSTITTSLTVPLPTPYMMPALAANIQDELAYQYHYDERNRQVEKKLPGKGWESIFYDRANRPAMTQDFIQKSTGKWLFAKYDAFGRKVYTGEYTDTTSRAALQAAQDAAGIPLYENRGGAISSNNYTADYTNNAYPVLPANPTLYMVQYYDNYTYNSSAYAPSVAGMTSALKGLPTGSFVWTLGMTSGNFWSRVVSAYDAKARLLWSYENNPYISSADTKEYQRDYIGNLTQLKTVHIKSGIATTIFDYFTYDNMQRVLKHAQQAGANAVELIAFNQYDNLGQLVARKVGGADAGTYTLAAGLQTVDYKFNTRGWLSKINDPSSMGADLFATELKYDAPTAGAALYNGNISQMFWKTANTDTALKNYNYTYDDLNRLRQAVFESNAGGTITQNGYNESASYDKNGNIATLARTGFTTIPDADFDNMAYSYQSNSNKLLSVSDSGSQSAGFINVTVAGTDDYAYDDNGNLTKDLNKGIAAGKIEYNQFNLPRKITLSATKTIEYVYNAIGTRLAKITTDGGITATTYYDGAFVYTMQGAATALQYYKTSEGYASPNGAAFRYVYQYKDHLGNVRLSYYKNGASLQVVEENNYYPFGMKHKGYNNVYNTGNATADKFDFNGRENEEFGGLNMIEMDFRQYDATVGRFFGIDPSAEQTPMFTPYHFGADNPVYFSDPSGLKVQPPSNANPTWPVWLQDLWDHSSGESTLWTNVTNDSGSYFQNGAGNVYDYNGGGFFESLSSYQAYAEQLWDSGIQLNEVIVQNNYKAPSSSTTSGSQNFMGTWDSFNTNVVSPVNGIASIFGEGAGLVRAGQTASELAKDAKLLKITGTISVVGNVLQMGYAGYQVYENPSTGNWTRLGVQAGIIGIEIGLNALVPGLGIVAGIGLSVLEAEYGQNFYDYIDN